MSFRSPDDVHIDAVGGPLPTRRLEIRREPTEVTVGGLFEGGPLPDPYRRFVPGPEEFLIDGEPVSRDEFVRAYEEQTGRKF